MKIFTILVAGLIWIGCRPKNADFDPFDNEFRFHKKFKLTDHDTIMGECGYWNLTNRNDGSYYQFNFGENEIVAKGFNITMDEINISKLQKDSAYRLFESLQDRKVDIDLIRTQLEKFRVKQITFLPDSTALDQVALIDDTGSTYYASVSTFYENNKVVRRISYFNDKNK